MATPAKPEVRILPSAVYEALVIDDDPAMIRFFQDAVQTPQLKICGATDIQTALDFVAQHRPPIVLLDLVMPGVIGMEMLERILAIDPGIDVILVTGHYSTDSAVEAIQKGAYDYLTKPLSLERLLQKLDKWLEEARLRRETHSLDEALMHAYQFAGIVGRSPLMLDVFSKIRRVAPHFQTALITGETGTGKELAAKALHELSPNASAPFVVCNCAAISETLFESELFGHTRGAFTGASQDKQGFVEAARGGTLFLDEITEIPLNIQVKLLRLLQNREIQPVGTAKPRHVDVRIVAATNRDLRTLVSEGKLREDLFYRLSMIEVKLPRLRDRREDLPLLERHFLELFAVRYEKPELTLTRRAQAAIAAYTWPGNIRELENVIGCCCMMAEGDTIDVRDLPPQLRMPSATPVEADSNEELATLEQVEKQHAHHVLERVGGNRVRAAEILGISRATLYRIIAK